MSDFYHNRHTCNTEVKVKHKKGKIHIDQFKFVCQDGKNFLLNSRIYDLNVQTQILSLMKKMKLRCGNVWGRAVMPQ